MQLTKRFGLDFVYVMIGINLSEKSASPVLDPAVRLFLTMWGYSPTEVNDVFESLRDIDTRKKLGDTKDAFERLLGYVKDDRSEAEKMIIHASAIAYLCNNTSDDRIVFLEIMRESLNLEVDVFDSLVDQGSYYAVGLNYFGSMYPKGK